jgi:hypothetical protein
MEIEDITVEQNSIDKLPTSDEKTMALLSHILTVVFWLIAPLVIYLVKKDESTFVAEHAKESLNFQLTLMLLYIISFILIFVIVGFFFLIALYFINLIFIIVATIKAAEGKSYKYPFTIRFIQ